MSDAVSVVDSKILFYPTIFEGSVHARANPVLRRKNMNGMEFPWARDKGTR
jgi:hypothetical protein